MEPFWRCSYITEGPLFLDKVCKIIQINKQVTSKTIKFQSLSMFYDQELTKSSKLGQRIKTLYHENITWQISGATR